ncbi:MAG: hypothetical protein GY757_36210 [bacterium]|nr:hypothetical protein [bacterium]
MKIRYNIATNRKVDNVKFALSASVVIVLSIIFLVLGISNIWSGDKRVQQQKKQLQSDREEIVTLRAKKESYKNGINNRKKNWSGKIQFLNTIIKVKNNTVIKKLNALEKSLPEGVFVTVINVNMKTPTLIRIVVAAQSLAALTKTYNSFAKYEPIISKESETDGFFQAGITLKIK